jgi:hypothetical protein
VPQLKEYARLRLGKHDILREEFISFATDLLIDKISRGYPIHYFGSRFDLMFSQFFREFNKNVKTVEFNEAANYKNEAI